VVGAEILRSCVGRCSFFPPVFIFSYTTLEQDSGDG